jgi:malonyl CoA-acyl carrier protein transacylase
LDSAKPNALHSFQQQVQACMHIVTSVTLVQGRVVSGHLDALTEVQKKAVTAGALKVQRLAVSGAFHTELMEPARQALLQVRGWVAALLLEP